MCGEKVIFSRFFQSTFAIFPIFVSAASTDNGYLNHGNWKQNNSEWQKCPFRGFLLRRFFLVWIGSNRWYNNNKELNAAHRDRPLWIWGLATVLVPTGASFGVWWDPSGKRLRWLPELGCILLELELCAVLSAYRNMSSDLTWRKQ